jgi:hypothetical protein
MREPLPEFNKKNQRNFSAGDASKDLYDVICNLSQYALNPWLQILAALEKKVIRQSFETWLKPTRYSHATGRTLYVRVPSPSFSTSATSTAT